MSLHLAEFICAGICPLKLARARACNAAEQRRTVRVASVMLQAVVTLLLLAGCTRNASDTLTESVPDRTPIANAHTFRLSVQLAGGDLSQYSAISELSQQQLAIALDNYNCRGMTFRRVGVSDFAEAIRTESSPRGVVVLKDRTAYALLGRRRIEDQGEALLLFDVLAGRYLYLAEPGLAELKIQDAWVLNQNGNSMLFPVGAGMLAIAPVVNIDPDVAPDDVIAASSVLRNCGMKPIELQFASTSCSCTVASDLKGVVLRPGDEHTIEYSAATSNVPFFEQHITIHFREMHSGEQSHASIRIFGCQHLFKPIAPTAIDFGNVYPGQSYTREVEVHDLPGETINVERADIGGMPVSAEIRRVTADRTTVSLTLALSLETSLETADQIDGSIVLTTSSRTFPRILVPLTYRPQPPITVTPSAADFGEVKPGTAVAQLLMLTAATDDIRILSIRAHSDSPLITAKSATIAGGGEVRVQFEPSAAGTFNEKLNVTIGTNQGEQTYEVPCFAIVR